LPPATTETLKKKIFIIKKNSETPNERLEPEKKSREGGCGGDSRNVRFMYGNNPRMKAKRMKPPKQTAGRPYLGDRTNASKRILDGGRSLESRTMPPTRSKKPPPAAGLM